MYSRTVCQGVAGGTLTKKDLAKVKAYAEAMADSNRARDTYVDKEQDKFFRRLNRQWVDINALKDQME